MREATKEERDGIKRFIESISIPTGNNIFEKKRSKMIEKTYKFTDLTGEKFNKLTVLSLHHRDNKNKTYYWLCKCDCGNESVVNGKHLKHGSIKSCGCLRKENFKRNKEKIEKIKKRNEELTEALMTIENLLLFNEEDKAEQIKKVCKKALGV